MRNGSFWAGCATGLALLGGAPARADFLVAEIEPNNTFATQQVLPTGAGRVTGTLTVGDLDNFRFTLAPGSQYYALISGLTGDTILGQRNDAGAIIRSDDDGGPGFQSLLPRAATPASGFVNLAVTSFPDFAFAGAPSPAAYTLNVLQAAAGTAADTGVNNSFATRQILAAGVGTVTGSLTVGDLDYFTFTGLTPGTAFIAEITDGTFDTIIGSFGTTGALVASDDDDGEGLLSRLGAVQNLVVSADGTVTIAVTAFADFGFAGSPAAGTYTLTLFAQQQGVVDGPVVPEPASVALLAVGGLGLAGCRRLRRARA